MTSKITQLQSENEEFKKRIETLTNERNDLLDGNRSLQSKVHELNSNV
jgi:predicted nuclease with TOPRIM domain